jgi:thioredoxin-related protein
MKIFLMIAACLLFSFAKANDNDSANIYNPKADAAKDIANAVMLAKAQHKFVLIQAGGNWCSWCLRFNKMVTTDPQLDSILIADFIVYHLNYSKENMNKDVFAKYGFPQRFGFPVFIILDENGNRLNTQNSEYLEEGKGYNKDKVMEFLESWSPAALDPKQYKN